jgi:hypothetical protein
MQDSLKNKGVLRLPQVVALYTGAVLGSGILILPGLAAELAGPASLIAWGLMAVLVVPMALTMGLLSAWYPDAGGVSSFVTKAFNPQLGSLIGWFFLLSVVIGAPVLALTGAGYICAAAGLGDTFRLLIAIATLSAGILLNYIGMKMTGQVQVAVVLTTIIVITVTLFGSFTAIEAANFTPFMPYGWESVGHAAAVLFWGFIGWEAISHISGEFVDPQRDAIRGTIIAAAIISILYFLTAFVVVGTHRCRGPLHLHGAGHCLHRGGFPSCVLTVYQRFCTTPAGPQIRKIPYTFGRSPVPFGMFCDPACCVQHTARLALHADPDPERHVHPDIYRGLCRGDCSLKRQQVRGHAQLHFLNPDDRDIFVCRVGSHIPPGYHDLLVHFYRNHPPVQGTDEAWMKEGKLLISSSRTGPKR